jgi:23S rRNA pseudouridine1911/1915/1917 synthase
MKNIEKTKKIIYKSINSGEIRIDQFLFSNYPEYSRAYFQKLIGEELILVNSKINKKSSYKLKENDEITINFPEVKNFDLSPKKIDFDIIDIQKDFIIINKPAGLQVHPSQEKQVDDVTLVNGLLYEFKELNQLEDKERPGIVHRLDKGTSGLMIVARNLPAQIKIANMFKERKINKTYLALVKGHPDKEGKIDLEIGRHRTKRHLMSHITHEGKPALTYYKVLAYYKDCSLVQAKIVTGRTHQIRVHFAAIGHGLIGDENYGFNSKEIQRPALHAWKLAFEFKHKRFNYCVQIPQDLQTILAKIS